MKNILLAVLLTVATLAYGQKIINDPNAEVRQVGSFQGISVGGGIDLFLTSGDEAVAISASSQEYRNQIKTSVENGVLKIWFDYKAGLKMFGNNKNLKAYVSYKTLNRLSASGGSDVEVEGIIKSANLKLNVSGGSDFTGKVNVDILDVQQSGGSDVNLEGTATRVEINASGGSDFSGFRLMTEVADIKVSGGSDCGISVSKELSADASGASDINYKGQPVMKELKTSGASKVSGK